MAPGCPRRCDCRLPLVTSCDVPLRRVHLFGAMVEGKPRYEVRIDRKVERGLGKLPASVQETIDYLLRDLKEIGPIQKEWKNFSNLGKNKYHCHLQSKYVAC